MFVGSLLLFCLLLCTANGDSSCEHATAPKEYKALKTRNQVLNKLKDDLKVVVDLRQQKRQIICIKKLCTFCKAKKSFNFF